MAERIDEEAIGEAIDICNERSISYLTANLSSVIPTRGRGGLHGSEHNAYVVVKPDSDGTVAFKDMSAIEEVLGSAGYRTVGHTVGTVSAKGRMKLNPNPNDLSLIISGQRGTDKCEECTINCEARDIDTRPIRQRVTASKSNPVH